MQVELKRIQREVEITFVYVTHDQEEALAMSDRIAVMRDGVVEQLGSPEEIYEHPARPFVAGFIGISNLLPAWSTTAACGWRTGRRSRRRCRTAWPTATRSSSPCGPRRSGSTSSRTGWRCSTAWSPSASTSGTTTQLIVELAPGARIVALEQNTARARADDRWELGDRVRVGWRPEHGQVLR